MARTCSIRSYRFRMRGPRRRHVSKCDCRRRLSSFPAASARARADYVDNTVVGMSIPYSEMPYSRAVLFQLFDQSCRQRISRAAPTGFGRHDVVHGRHHLCGAWTRAVAQALERLWRRDFVNQVKIYVKDDRGVGFRNHDMRLPDFLKQRFWFHTVTISAT